MIYSMLCKMSDCLTLQSAKSKIAFIFLISSLRIVFDLILWICFGGLNYPNIDAFVLIKMLEWVLNLGVIVSLRELLATFIHISAFRITENEDLTKIRIKANLLVIFYIFPPIIDVVIYIIRILLQTPTSNVFFSYIILDRMDLSLNQVIYNITEGQVIAFLLTLILCAIISNNNKYRSLFTQIWGYIFFHCWFSVTGFLIALAHILFGENQSLNHQILLECMVVNVVIFFMLSIFFIVNFIFDYKFSNFASIYSFTVQILFYSLIVISIVIFYVNIENLVNLTILYCFVQIIICPFLYGKGKFTTFYE